MKHLLIILFCGIVSFQGFSSDSLEIVRINKEIEKLEIEIKSLKSNEANYKIEKDILKETYETNYESISKFITIILGIFGVLGYFGIRDINSIKKEYQNELNSLKELKNKFEIKSKEFDEEKVKFDSELKSILKENEEQNKKIKFIELKEKVSTLLKDDNLTSALEFASVALEINPEDSNLLNDKGRILCRLNEVTKAIPEFRKALAIDPTNEALIVNLVECLYFANEIAEAKEIIDKNKSLFKSKANGQLLILLDLFELYHNENKDELIEKVKNLVVNTDMESQAERMKGWDLKDAFYFVAKQPKSDLKHILINAIGFLYGKQSGKRMFERLGIEPNKENEDE